MVGTALDKVVGYVDRRVVLTVLVPLLAFSSAGVGLVVAHVGWPGALEWWNGLASEQQVLLAVVTGAGLLFSAVLLSGHIGLLTRWFEGYWGEQGLPSRLAEVARTRQQRRHARLDPNSDRDYEIRYRQYPRRAADVLPTRLGNVLKGAETYPTDEGRYGMDAVFFWPRLYAVLPQHFRETLGEARSSLDLMIVTTFLATTFAVVSAIYLALAGERRWWLWVTAVGAAVLLARLVYLGAVRSAAVFAELVRCAFDLYRGDLRERLGFAAPASLDDERALWEAVGQQLYRRMAGDPTRLAYPASPGSEGTSEP